MVVCFFFFFLLLFVFIFLFLLLFIILLSTRPEKRNPNPKLLSPDIFWWGGGLPREGVGAKSSVCPSKLGKPNFFGGVSWDLLGYPGAPEKFEKKR